VQEEKSRSRGWREVLSAELGHLRPTLGELHSQRTRQPLELREIYGRIGKLSKLPAEPPGNGPLAALCLSGGGIRSATFNLGVIQKLAAIGLLGKLDYLSSVSGGGYIAAWLRAWMHREGVEPVLQALARVAPNADPLATEPKPIVNLRRYSNYLTPSVGLFSGDTWAAAATILRNLILNWIVLIPILAAVIGIPLLFLLFMKIPQLALSWGYDLLQAAIAVEAIASLSVYGLRRFAKQPARSQALFIFCCVLPICLAAGLLSAAGIQMGLPWSGLGTGPSARDQQHLWAFAAIWSIAVPVVGWGLVEGAWLHFPLAKRLATGKGKDQAPRDTVELQARQVSPGTEFIALLVSGSVGTVLFVGMVRWWLPFLYNHPALYAVLVLPLLLGAYLIARVIFIGFASLSDGSGGVPAGSRISSNDSDREWWSRLSGWVLLIIAAWTSVTGICLIGNYLPDLVARLFASLGLTWHEALATAVKWTIGIAGGLSGLIAALTGSSAKTPAAGNAEAKPPAPSTARLLVITGPLFLTCLIMVISWGVKALGVAVVDRDAFQLGFDEPAIAQPVKPWVMISFLGLLVGLAAVGILASWIANVNRFSLHGMYRNRLVRAYLGASNCSTTGADTRTPDPFTGFALDDNFPLCRLCEPALAGSPPGGRPGIQRPLSIINTTLNLVHGENLAWQQRKAESFSMTPLFCGSWLEGYRSSTEYGGPGGITVGTAMTISGAAANPNMGYSSSPVLGFLMAMFNVRLGAWLGNTNPRGDLTYNRPGPRLGIIPLLEEMFGLTNSDRGYVNLSDGGHFDNLGLYEVVLRRCRQVIVSDAGQDGAFSFEDLGNSIRKIRIDFGINIEFEKIQILPNTPEKEGLCCAIARIRYSDVDGTSADDDGFLIYLKPTLRGRGAQMPYDIYSYSRSSSDFPHESTVDQWFSESQFESYRALGSHLVEQVAGALTSRTDSGFEELYASVRAYMAKP
jgi:hypothetical protein